MKIGNWKKEKDEQILKKREELGSKWMTIKNHFKNRTDSMIKNRYKYLINENPNIVHDDMRADNNLTKNQLNLELFKDNNNENIKNQDEQLVFSKYFNQDERYDDNFLSLEF